jgi:chemotaxis protein MotB
MSSETPVKAELPIIIKKVSGEEPPAKGGAWKIAYADFVTAMMAFFLVMWLINSANEVTKARVASYFNPIKMTDTSPVRRGLKEVVDAQSQKNNVEIAQQDSGAADQKAEKPPASELKLSHSAVMANPEKILDEISKGASQIETESAGGAGSGSADPFDPKIVQQEDIAIVEKDTAETPVEEVKSEEKVEAAEAKGEVGKDASATAKEEFAGVSEKKIEVARALELTINQAVSEIKGTLDLSVTVKATDEGVLVVLEDGSKKSMFAIGSAQPNPALVQILGKVGEILNSRSEKVAVRGHTDARRFRIETYDNWQLSTDRAHMASYMLRRGGLSETRIARIEGYGSSRPAILEDMYAGANRRIEILLSP